MSLMAFKIIIKPKTIDSTMHNIANILLIFALMACISCTENDNEIKELEKERMELIKEREELHKEYENLKREYLQEKKAFTEEAKSLTQNDSCISKK